MVSFPREGTHKVFGELLFFTGFTAPTFLLGKRVPSLVVEPGKGQLSNRCKMNLNVTLQELDLSDLDRPPGARKIPATLTDAGLMIDGELYGPDSMFDRGDPGKPTDDDLVWLLLDGGDVDGRIRAWNDRVEAGFDAVLDEMFPELAG